MTACCHLNCAAPAEYRIAAMRPDGSFAGPDPYGDETEACTGHVGDLLGHQPGAARPNETEYRVRPLTSARGES